MFGWTLQKGKCKINGWMNLQLVPFQATIDLGHTEVTQNIDMVGPTVDREYDGKDLHHES